MDKLVSPEVYRSFRNHESLFTGLGAEAIAVIAAAGCDLALVLSAEGVVLDVSFRDRALKGWGIEQWLGRPWIDTVTVESRDKISELLHEAMTVPATRARQVNHSAAGVRDLPVGYRVISFPGMGERMALGSDLRAMAEMQQRLVRAQVDMEKDYRKLRDIESRYRILFHLAFEPLVVVEAQGLKILDANEGAGRLLDKPLKKIAGASALTLFARQDQTAVAEALAAVGARARGDVFHARPATMDEAMEIRVTPFREFGRTNLLVCFSSEDHGAGTGTPSGAESILSLVESLPEGIVLANGEGGVVDANPAFLDLIRVVDLDRIENKGLDNWLGGSNVDLQVLMANLREHGTVRRFSSVIRDELGGIENVEVAATKFASADGPLYGFAIREVARNESMPTGLNGHSHQPSQFTDLVGRVPLKDLVRDTADIIEKLCIEAALRLTDNNRASAADMLGLSRQSLYIKLKRFGISDFDPNED